MLVLSSNQGETIYIGNDIEITVLRAANGTVRLAFKAPSDVRIIREKLRRKIQESADNATT